MKRTSASLQANSHAVVVSSPQPYGHASGTITVIAGLSNAKPDDYDMFWYVDNGSWNWMDKSPNRDTKQADIDVSNWTWHERGDAYTINVVAVSHGNGQRFYGSVPINIGAAAIAPKQTIATVKPDAASPTSAAAVPQQKSADSLYVNPNNGAAQIARNASDPAAQRILEKLATMPTATWFGNWNSNIQSDVAGLVAAADNANQTPVLVAYDIPGRDCGSYSAGGAASAASYREWAEDFAAGIGSRSAIVILEPDALAQMTCLSSGDQTQRYQLLNHAIATLKSRGNTKVYIDAGNPTWVAADDMAGRLIKAGISAADGFSLNVSNFVSTPDNVSYGSKLSSQLNGKHFVIDTSRNGNGANGEWCNPLGRALGAAPSANTGNALVDYYLWVKVPGESDGACNGGPPAGVWWSEYAQTLARNAGW